MFKRFKIFRLAVEFHTHQYAAQRQVFAKCGKILKMPCGKNAMAVARIPVQVLVVACANRCKKVYVAECGAGSEQHADVAVQFGCFHSHTAVVFQRTIAIHFRLHAIKHSFKNLHHMK